LHLSTIFYPIIRAVSSLSEMQSERPLSWPFKTTG
jgi:hypothetical protein